MGEWILKGTDVRRWYGEGEVAVHALNGVSFEIRPREFVVVLGPSAAIVPDTDGDAVYVKKGSRAILTSVETGEQSDGRTEIVSGLEEGQEIITNPYDVDISDGKRVK